MGRPLGIAVQLVITGLKVISCTPLGMPHLEPNPFLRMLGGDDIPHYSLVHELFPLLGNTFLVVIQSLSTCFDQFTRSEVRTSCLPLAGDQAITKFAVGTIVRCVERAIKWKAPRLLYLPKLLWVYPGHMAGAKRSKYLADDRQSGSPNSGGSKCADSGALRTVQCSTSPSRGSGEGVAPNNSNHPVWFLRGYESLPPLIPDSSS